MNLTKYVSLPPKKFLASLLYVTMQNQQNKQVTLMQGSPVCWDCSIHQLLLFLRG